VLPSLDPFHGYAATSHDKRKQQNTKQNTRNEDENSTDLDLKEHGVAVSAAVPRGRSNLAHAR
jgi:hypothetical protein